MLTVKFPFMLYVIRIVITFAISSYNVPVATKKRILMKAKKSCKYRKATLFAICDEERGKVARSSVITPHSTGRKGIPIVEHHMKKENPDGKVDRPVLYMATHVYKDIPDDPLHPKHVAAKKVAEVREIYERDPNSSRQKHLDSDAVSSVGGSEIYHDIVSSEGYVRGMGGEVSKTEILASAACREQLRIEKLNNQGLQTQMNALEERFNVFVAERQDNNTSQPSTAAPLQKVFALGRVNFSTSPNDENYEVIVDIIVDEHMELCVGDGKLGDIVLSETIEWPKQYVTRSVGC
ncbi:hypothetical protein MKX03_025271 [Papaver bracteatum]|nr:hypothetical protein MKX03_025271 [Papaver bracteatum]